MESFLHVQHVKRQAVKTSVLPQMISLREARNEGNANLKHESHGSQLTVYPSYVAALELRIEKLERRLQYAKTRKASLAFDEPDMSILAQQVDRRDSLAKIKAAIHRKAARSRENSDVNSIVSDFGFLYGTIHVSLIIHGA